jgi:hypothetical protein
LETPNFGVSFEVRLMSTEDACGGDHLPVPLVADAPDLANRQLAREFDYSGVPSNATNELLERRAQIVGAVKKTTEAIIAIGRDLTAAKKILGHGRFVAWVEVECGFRIRTAQNYMAISRLSAKYACVAHFPVGLTLRLARTRGRFDFLDKVSANIAPGRRPTEDEVCALLGKFKKMRALQPKRPRGRRPARLKPVERPSQEYGGWTKTEWARANAEHAFDQWGFECLLFINTWYATNTVAETLPFIRAILCREEFKHGLGDLYLSTIQE